ncbi:MULTISPECIES: class Ib ribonucleoside-diphosphate reductase assembly flavoprotein NrdI [Bacillaceae]|uniref:Protein NrdI n=1 Tax=Gottfriedia luciferensis TaxID=178774 RepID=A0ABX2ZMJ3_9BACI|nr:MULTISPECIES: class Ib ribonucleoside-diphosphate reductase assembly flavoprotein NrdI [Bacillaceae]ODG89727.1 ribonucleotide reductase assembly protein NrdI [Gottfriedia luciferensis]PGZ86300.1 class Ib ribonucleoside-diphosphate reductase assembly flavoprotein NrdI [Bacillus sp. AFS029533]SFC72241.1 protein involved in ribonucleotide reduction [Bacillus sp. UNCCL81]
MVIVYSSMTGNVKRFVNKVRMPSIQIKDGLKIEVPYILVTYTTGFGNVPENVSTFLKSNSKYLKAVSASGNKNWGDSFAASADKIASDYQVPVLSKFELSGTSRDVQYFIEGVEKLETY